MKGIEQSNVKLVGTYGLENSFDNHIEFSGDNISVKEELEERIRKNGRLEIFNKTKLLSWYTLILLIIANRVTLLIENKENYVDTTLLLTCVILVLLLIATEVIPFVSASVLFQNRCIKDLEAIEDKFDGQFTDLQQSENKQCARVTLPDELNAYNLFTYKQIQLIEHSLVGANSKIKGGKSETNVYCYSRYRDDGGIGPDETERIVEENVTKKGIRYHFFYYEDSPRGENKQFKPSRSGETYINLSLSKQLNKNEAYKQCLDYRIYSNARFDVMIYEKPGKKEGYFCLNFPVDKTMCEQCQNENFSNCQLKFSDGSTDKLLYKKMPEKITDVLLNKLKDFEKRET